MKTCAVKGCTNPAGTGRGMCHKHYKRWQVTGQTGLVNGKGCDDVHERMRFQTKSLPNGCIEWAGTVSRNGYGQTKWMYKFYSAHKLAWTLANGTVPDGMYVCHRCNNKRCVNVAHLYLGTPAQNSADALRDGLLKAGEHHPNSKLTDKQREEICASTENPKTLAPKYGISWSQVYRIRNMRRAA